MLFDMPKPSLVAVIVCLTESRLPRRRLWL